MASLRLSIVLLLASALGIKGLSLDELHSSQIPEEQRSDSLQRALDSVSHRRRLLDRKRSPGSGGDPWRRLPALKRQAEEVEDFLQVQEESDDPRLPFSWIGSLSEVTATPVPSDSAHRKMAWLVRQLQEAVRDYDDSEHLTDMGMDKQRSGWWGREREDRNRPQDFEKEALQGRHWWVPERQGSDEVLESEGSYFPRHRNWIPEQQNVERVQESRKDSSPGRHWRVQEPPPSIGWSQDLEEDNNVDRRKRRPSDHWDFSSGRNEKRFTDGPLTTFDLYNRRYGRHQFRSYPLTPRTAFFQATDDGPLSGSSDDFHDEVLVSRKRKRQAAEIPPSVSAHQMAAKAMSRKQKSPMSMKKKKNKKKILNPKEFFDYASGVEHHSTYWDPSYSSMNLPQGYGEGSKRGTNKARALTLAHPRKEESRKNVTVPAPVGNAVKPSIEKPQKDTKNQDVVLRLKKRSEPVMGADNKKALSKELNQILQDDESSKKSSNNTTGSSKKRERKLREVKDSSLEDDPEKGGISENNRSNSRRRSKFNDWLRQEYYKTLATMKPKRSDWTPLVSRDIDDLLETGEISDRQKAPWRGSMSAGREEDDNEEGSGRTIVAASGVETEQEPFIDVEEKLRRIQNAMLSDALGIISEGAQSKAESDMNEERVASRLEAAYDLEKMRLAMEHLRDTMQRMEGQEVAIREEDIKRKNKLGHWSAFPVEEKRDKSLTDALHVMAPSSEKREDGEDTLDPGESCPPLRLLTSDCSAVADVLSHSAVRQPMVQACNWHEVCYTCGEAYGLTASDCDVGFMEASRAICQENRACEAMSRLLLLPLHQKRVFFKRSIPATCFSDPCVDRFLGQR